MGKGVVIRLGFGPEMEHWEFGYFTMELFVWLFVFPNIRQQTSAVSLTFKKYDIAELCRRFQRKENIELRFDQSLFFMKCAAKISEFLVSSYDAELEELIRKKVIAVSDKFETVKDFRDYYVQHSTEIIRTSKEYFAINPKLLELFEKSF